MPVGGSQYACANALQSPLPGALILDGAPLGSSYEGGFTGTSYIPTSPWSIPGFSALLNGNTPSAGAEEVYTFSGLGSSGGGARTCIQSIQFGLTTSATAANRLPAIELIASGVVIGVYSATTAQTASTTQTYVLEPGTVEQVTTGSTIFHLMPFNNGQPFCINSGFTSFTINSLTAGLQSGDQYTGFHLFAQIQQDNN